MVDQFQLLLLCGFAVGVLVGPFIIVVLFHLWDIYEEWQWRRTVAKFEKKWDSR